MGGNHCVVRGCTNTSSTTKDKTFHSFPSEKRNPTTRQKWISAVKRNQWQPSKCSKLCSDHFDPECYRLRPGTSYRLLKEDALPTNFRKRRPKIRKRRSLKRKAKQVPVKVIKPQLAKPVRYPKAKQTMLYHDYISTEHNYSYVEGPLPKRSKLVTENLWRNNDAEPDKIHLQRKLLCSLLFIYFVFLRYLMKIKSSIELKDAEKTKNETDTSNTDRVDLC